MLVKVPGPLISVRHGLAVWLSGTSSVEAKSVFNVYP